MASYKGANNIPILILFLLIGGLAGSAAADALPHVPFVKTTAMIGFDPATLDLHFMTLTVGFKTMLSPLTALGLIVGYWAYRKI